MGGVVDVAVSGRRRGATAQGADASTHGRSVAFPPPRVARGARRRAPGCAERPAPAKAGPPALPPIPGGAHDPRSEVEVHASSKRALPGGRRDRCRDRRLCRRRPALVALLGRRSDRRGGRIRRRRPGRRRDRRRDARRGDRRAAGRGLALARPDGLQPRRLVQLRHGRHEGRQRRPDPARPAAPRSRGPGAQLARHCLRRARPRARPGPRALRGRDHGRRAGGRRAGPQGCGRCGGGDAGEPQGGREDDAGDGRLRGELGVPPGAACRRPADPPRRALPGPHAGTRGTGRRRPGRRVRLRSLRHDPQADAGDPRPGRGGPPRRGRRDRAGRAPGRRSRLDGVDRRDDRRVAAGAAAEDATANPVVADGVAATVKRASRKTVDKAVATADGVAATVGRAARKTVRKVVRAADSDDEAASTV